MAYPYLKISSPSGPTPFDNSNASNPWAPPTPTELTVVFIFANEPEVFKSINEPLSIVKLILPPSSPVNAPVVEDRAVLKINSVPIDESSTLLKSIVDLGSVVPIPILEILLEALRNNIEGSDLSLVLKSKVLFMCILPSKATFLFLSLLITLKVS